VTATWEGRGDNVTFHFPLRILRPASSPEPTLSPEPTPSPSPSPSGDLNPAAAGLERMLRGSSWSLGEVDGVTLDIERAPTAIFGTGRVGGFAGCNSYGADAWSVEGGRLLISDPMTTLIGCQGQTEALEEHFLAILGSEPFIVMNPTDLSLSSEEGKMLLERIDVDHDDIVGSYLDCAWWDRVDVRPALDVILDPAVPSYLTANLPWIEQTDEIRQIAQTNRWVVVRDELVIAEVWAEDLSGVACASSGA
jgi:heat shock protein HslJ